MFHTPKSPTSDPVMSAVTTDDCTLATPHDSPMKHIVKSRFGDHCDYTEKDPLVSISDCTTHRDRPSRHTGVSHRLSLHSLQLKYPC